VNETTGYAGNLIDLQQYGVSKFKVVGSTGDTTIAGTFFANTIQSQTGSTGSLTINGGQGSPGGIINLIGGTNATNPGIIQFRTGTGSGAQPENENR
jgi:hypothetical protein